MAEKVPKSDDPNMIVAMDVDQSSVKVAFGARTNPDVSWPTLKLVLLPLRCAVW